MGRSPTLRAAAIAVAGAMRAISADSSTTMIGAARRGYQLGAPPVDKNARNDGQVVTAPRQPEPEEYMASILDRITDLIAQRPGIRTAEIADALDLDLSMVRPAINGRIQNSRIIADKVLGPNNKFINAYRINPKWTPADEAFEPAVAQQEDDTDKWPTGPGRRAATAPAAPKEGLKVAAPRKPAARAAKAPATTQKAAPGGRAQTGDAGAERAVDAPVARATTRGIVPANDTPAARPVVDAAPPAERATGPVFRCGIWSDGVLELQRDGATFTTLTRGEGEQMAAFIGRMLVAVEPAEEARTNQGIE